MTDKDFEMISAYMDGELSPTDKAIVEFRLDQDPEMRKLLMKMRQQDLYLRASVNSIERVPMKPALEQLLGHPASESVFPAKGSNVVSLFRYRVKRLPLMGVSAALVLMLAVFLGSNFLFNSSSQQIDMPLSQLNDALNNIHAGEEFIYQQGVLTEVLAFTREDGVLCKQYIDKQSDVVTEAIACSENSSWKNVLVQQIQAGSNVSSTEYIPASGGESAIDAYIQSNISGAALTIEQEKAELKKSLMREQ